MTNVARVGGIAAFLFSAFYLVSFVFASPIVGLEDGDNPASSLVFLKQHADFYFISGLSSALAAIALTSLVICLVEAGLFPTPTKYPLRIVSTFGLFTAAFLFGHGILRMNASGTLLYLDDLSRDWGQSAYLAVQMAGTQGLAAAGVFGFGVWSLGLSLAGWRNRAFPRVLAVAGIVPALPWLLGLLGQLGVLPESVWLLYIGAMILGIPLWSVAVGLFLLRWQPTS